MCRYEAIKYLVVAHIFKGLKDIFMCPIKDFRVEQQFGGGRKKEKKSKRKKCKDEMSLGSFMTRSSLQFIKKSGKEISNQNLLRNFLLVIFYFLFCEFAKYAKCSECVK